MSRELELLESKFETLLDQENNASQVDRISISSKQSLPESANKRRPASAVSKRGQSAAGRKLPPKAGKRCGGPPLPPSSAGNDDMSQKMIEIKVEIEKIDAKIAENGGFH